MSDPIVRRLIANSRSIGQLQSAHTMSFSPNVLYASFKNSETQIPFPNTLYFLIWGYSLLDSEDNLSSSSSFIWSPGSSVIIVPEQGYYAANISLVWDLDFFSVPTVIMNLYVNDVVVQSSSQVASSVSYGTNFSFLFFAEQNSTVQFAVTVDSQQEIIVTDASMPTLPDSPVVNIFKVV